MVYNKFIIVATLVAVVRGGVVAPIAPVAAPIAVAAKLADSEFDPNPQYSFAYDVQDTLTGDSKSQVESRSGNLVQGQYSVVDPDGTRRIVDYTADPINGFNAVVSKTPLAKVVAAAPIVAKAAAPAVVAATKVAATPIVATSPVTAPLVASTPFDRTFAAPYVVGTTFGKLTAPIFNGPAVAKLAAPFPAPLVASPYTYSAKVAAPLTYTVI